jgi:hypothetical protein
VAAGVLAILVWLPAVLLLGTACRPAVNAQRRQ